MKEVTDTEFSEAIKNGQGNAVVDFWAPWCGPCKAVAPVLDELSSEYGGKLSFMKINVDENQEHATTLNVRGIPTVFLMKNGQVVETLTGSRSKEEYRAAIAKAFGV